MALINNLTDKFCSSLNSNDNTKKKQKKKWNKDIIGIPAAKRLRLVLKLSEKFK
jgi:hypothetical protein